MFALAVWAACFTESWPVRICPSIVRRMLPFSTSTQCFAVGTNQLAFAARSLTVPLSRLVAFGMFPTAWSAFSFAVFVKSAIHARAWIADFTSTANEKALQAVGNIPNATNLLNNSVNDRAAKASWFVPTAKHWVDVENGNILRTMLGQIVSGQLSTRKAAQTADANIAYTLNQS